MSSRLKLMPLDRIAMISELSAILEVKKITEMNEKITQSVKKINKNVEILFSELLVEKEDSHIETDLKNLEKNAIPRLYGSGLLIVNPVWNTGNFLEKCLPYISNALGENASYSIKKY